MWIDIVCDLSILFLKHFNKIAEQPDNYVNKKKKNILKVNFLRICS